MPQNPFVPEVADDDPDAGTVDIKEALGLPDALPPIRLPSTAELAAQARSAPLPGRLAALAAWAGRRAARSPTTAT